MRCFVGRGLYDRDRAAGDSFRILRKDELIFRMSRVGGRKREREGGGNGWIGSGAVFHEPFAGMINALPTPIPLPSLLSLAV